MTKRKPSIPAIAEPMVTVVYRGPSGALHDGNVRLIRNGPPGELPAGRFGELDADPTVWLDVIGDDGVARSRDVRRRAARAAAHQLTPTTTTTPDTPASSGQEDATDG